MLPNHLIFRKDRATLVTRLIEGQFPDYQGVIPKDHKATATVAHEGPVASVAARVPPVQ